MAENSKIEWCDHTVNLWWGCSKVHTGCKNCYAEYLSDTRYKNELWGENTNRKRIMSAFKDLDKYQKQGEKENKMLKIFCGSMMDIFESSKDLLNPTEEYKTTWCLREDLFFRIANGYYDNLIFLFLTKRPENILEFIPEEWIPGAPNNVWFGTSVSNQETADEYVDRLRMRRNSNLFLSVEPQVGDIDSMILDDIGWVIQGGESGHKKRPFNIDWAYKMKDYCQYNDVPYFFKQIDKIKPIPEDLNVKEFPGIMT